MLAITFRKSLNDNIKFLMKNIDLMEKIIIIEKDSSSIQAYKQEIISTREELCVYILSRENFNNVINSITDESIQEEPFTYIEPPADNSALALVKLN